MAKKAKASEVPAGRLSWFDEKTSKPLIVGTSPWKDTTPSACVIHTKIPAQCFVATFSRAI